jgi:hypothetical protein
LGNANRSYSVRFDGRLFNTLTGIAEYSQERSGWAAANIEANGLAPPATLSWAFSRAFEEISNALRARHIGYLMGCRKKRRRDAIWR